MSFKISRHSSSGARQTSVVPIRHSRSVIVIVQYPSTAFAVHSSTSARYASASATSDFIFLNSYVIGLLLGRHISASEGEWLLVVERLLSSFLSCQ